jgi:hypothetical protein
MFGGDAMVRILISTFAGIAVLVAGGSWLTGCGERRGGYTYETTLDETLDNYVHPVKRRYVDLTATRADSIKGVEGLPEETTKFGHLILGNYHERIHLALVDRFEEEGRIELLLDEDFDLNLANEKTYPLHPYEEGSPYFLSDTLVVSYSVDTGGERNTIERKLYFIYKRSEEEGWLRYDFIGHRTGTFDHLPGDAFGFILFDADFNGYYDHRDILVIDTNRDGVIDGNRNSVERYRMSEPFLLGGRPYRVVGINRMGLRLSIMPHRGEVTPRDRLEIGEAAPDFTLMDVSAQEIGLSDYSGKTVLLLFWASG